MHCNCTRTGFEVRVCTVSSLDVRKKNSFHKLISVIRIFMRKIFLVQYHPQNIFNIEVFLNHGIKNDSVLPKNCLCKMNDRHMTYVTVPVKRDQVGTKYTISKNYT